MLEVQFISELMSVVLENKIVGFDQDVMDALYAQYDEPDETILKLDVDAFDQRFSEIRSCFAKMNSNGAVSRYAKGFGDLYTLWALVAAVKQSYGSERISAAV